MSENKPGSHVTQLIAEANLSDSSTQPEPAVENPAQTLARLSEALQAVLEGWPMREWGFPWRKARLLLEVEKRIDPGTALPLARDYVRLINQNAISPEPWVLCNLLFYLAAEQDPVEAVRVARGFPASSSFREVALEGVWEALQAAPDQARVEEVLALLDNPKLRDDWARGLRLARLEDPEARVRFLMENVSLNPRALQQPYFHLALHDPKSALSLFQELNANQQDMLRDDLANGLVKAMDFDEAWALVGEMEPSGKRAYFEAQLLKNLGRHDVDHALRVLENLPIQPSHQSLYYYLGKNLVEKDPQRAMAWAEQLPPGPEKGSVMAAITEKAAQQPVETLRWLEATLPDNPQRRDALSRALWQIVREDPEFAREWIAARPELVAQDGLHLGQIFGGYADRDPEAALRFFEELNPPHDRVHSIRGLGRELADRDPEIVRDFFKRLEDPKEKKALAQTAGGILAVRDLPAAASWADEMEPGEPRDQLVREIAGQMWGYDLPGAVIWAGTIQKEISRHNLQTRYAEEWVTRDPLAAKRWLEEGHLPEDRTRKILQQADAELKRREEEGL